IIIILLGFTSPLYGYDSAHIKSQLKPEKGDLFKSLVIDIVDGDTIILENNTTVRLVGIQAPKIALNRKNFKEWPLGYEAKDALRDLTMNKSVLLYYGGRKLDRYGRALAHLFLEDGTWVQGEMLKQGMARVYSFSDNRSIVDDMMKEEKEARLKNTGIWSLDYYKIKPQEISGKHTNSFQVISGRIIDVATVRSNTYLNFGDDYKTDFTIVVPGRVKKMFEKKDINLTNLEGKNIFVRGWLKYYNGPSIDLSHPEQLVIQ
ncbi:MAG: thermonuclease family protein, partial [Kordiimonadaceae bacterium]|nr:thermonuclease family protein [Kordiimonadaceae bacterium]